MKTNAAGLEIVKRNEGLRLDAYQDVVGIWTVGYGDTGPDVGPGLRITEEEAERRLADRLAREFEPGVLKALGDAPATDNQFSAMVSLAYNIGVGAFAGSTVARMHNAGNHAAAAEAFGMWVKAKGTVYAGLVRRRQEEADLYMRQDAPVTDYKGGPNALGDPIVLIRQAQTMLGVHSDGDPGPITREAAKRWREAHS